jgi:hypothetical protein
VPELHGREPRVHWEVPELHGREPRVHWKLRSSPGQLPQASGPEDLGRLRSSAGPLLRCPSAWC